MDGLLSVRGLSTDEVPRNSPSAEPTVDSPAKGDSANGDASTNIEPPTPTEGGGRVICYCYPLGMHTCHTCITLRRRIDETVEAATCQIASSA